MNYEQTVAEFLAKPANLPFALEVAQHVEKAKDHLQVQFWNLYYADMEKRLHASSNAGRWKVIFTRPGQLLAEFQSCWLQFDVGHTQSIQLHVGLNAESRANKYNCVYGLNWSRKQDGSSDPKVVGDLIQALMARSLVVNTNDWWLTYTRLKYSLREDTFLIRYAKEPHAVVQEIGDIVWSLFTQMREPLEAANEAFAKYNP